LCKWSQEYQVLTDLPPSPPLKKLEKLITYPSFLLTMWLIQIKCYSQNLKIGDTKESVEDFAPYIKKADLKRILEKSQSDQLKTPYSKTCRIEGA
jgi:hypothetical protein